MSEVAKSTPALDEHPQIGLYVQIDVEPGMGETHVHVSVVVDDPELATICGCTAELELQKAGRLSGAGQPQPS